MPWKIGSSLTNQTSSPGATATRSGVSRAALWWSWKSERRAWGGSAPIGSRYTTARVRSAPERLRGFPTTCPLSEAESAGGASTGASGVQPSAHAPSRAQTVRMVVAPPAAADVLMGSSSASRAER
jgi:hypothetical protein